MIEAYWGKLFIGYLLIGTITALIHDLCTRKIFSTIKRDEPGLYEDIRQGYDEGWTKPGGIVSHSRDRPMVNRFHKKVVDRKCMAHMSENLYWVYRISNWISAPVSYVFFSFAAWFVFTTIQMILSY